MKLTVNFHNGLTKDVVVFGGGGGGFSDFTKLCFRAPTTASSLASRDIIGLAKLGRADSI